MKPDFIALAQPDQRAERAAMPLAVAAENVRVEDKVHHKCGEILLREILSPFLVVCGHAILNRSRLATGPSRLVIKNWRLHQLPAGTLATSGKYIRNLIAQYPF